MNIINQYSYIVVGFLVLAASIIMLRRSGANRIVIRAAGGALIAAFIAGFFALRPGASSVDNLAAAEAVINSGRPTLVEFYSNYCAGCMSVRATMERVESDIMERYGDDFNVLRVDIHTDFGRILRERYGFSFTPEFIIFNSSGHEVWRSHVPPSFEDLTMVASSGNLAEVSRDS